RIKLTNGYCNVSEVSVRCRVNQRSACSDTFIPVVSVTGSGTCAYHVELTEDVRGLQTAGRADERDEVYAHRSHNLIFNLKFHHGCRTVVDCVSGFHVVRSGRQG